MLLLAAAIPVKAAKVSSYAIVGSRTFVHHFLRTHLFSQLRCFLNSWSLSVT
jgi:hypothetical protein